MREGKKQGVKTTPAPKTRKGTSTSEPGKEALKKEEDFKTKRGNQHPYSRRALSLKKKGSTDQLKHKKTQPSPARRSQEDKKERRKRREREKQVTFLAKTDGSSKEKGQQHTPSPTIVLGEWQWLKIPYQQS